MEEVMTGKQSSAMDRAEKSVKAGILTATEAAKKYGITAQAIYRRPWYKALRKQKAEASK
jgi:hypothetical protein